MPEADNPARFKNLVSLQEALFQIDQSDLNLGIHGNMRAKAGEAIWALRAFWLRTGLIGANPLG